MNYPLILNQSSDGGVEEKKDDEPVTLSPDRYTPHTNGLHHPYSSSGQHIPPPNDDTAAEAMNHNNNIHNNNNSRNHPKPDGFQAHIQNFVRTIVASCESVVTFLVRGGEGGCPPWPTSNHGGVMSPTNYNNNNNNNHRPAAVVHPPLSITEELRKLAESEGRVFGGGMRRADIPRFLGEEAVYSFDDDNISAISQHTLEEMTKHGIKHPVRRKLSSESSQSTSSQQPPPPVPMKVELIHVYEEREGIV